MPIDTRNKRASAVQMVALLTMPNPSGTIGAAAREHVTWLYSGITAHTPIAGAAPVGGLYWSRNEN